MGGKGCGVGGGIRNSGKPTKVMGPGLAERGCRTTRITCPTPFPACHVLQAVEAAAQKLMMEEVTNATERFNAALALDELSLEANAGSLEAQILAGGLDEAAGHVRPGPRGGGGL
jgi:hypothetical protein